MPASSSSRTALPGTRPEGAADERDAARRVQQMFGEIAPRYDLLNHLLSLSLDRIWRRRTALAFDHILRLPNARVLDLCCGTGDLALELKRQATHSCSPGAAILASDFAFPMLVRAQAKNNARGRPEKWRAREIRCLGADALSLPFPDASFDLVTVAFGFRNLANYEAGLREIYRLLKPRGEVGILEFSEPRGPLFGPVYRFYFTRILPRIGGAISGRGSAYSYLPASVAKFPSPEELSALMSAAGFIAVQFEQWTGGTVTLHRAVRP